MSTKIENVVYRASWHDEISANFESESFSTATGNFTNPLAPVPAIWRPHIFYENVAM
jgi:hypothetical protein